MTPVSQGIKVQHRTGKREQDTTQQGWGQPAEKQREPTAYRPDISGTTTQHPIQPVPVPETPGKSSALSERFWEVCEFFVSTQLDMMWGAGMVNGM